MAEKTKAELQSDLHDANARIETLEQKLAGAHDPDAALRDEITKLTGERDQAKEALAGATDARDRAAAAADEAATERQRLAAQLNAATDAARRQATRIAELEEQVTSALGEVARLQGETANDADIRVRMALNTVRKLAEVRGHVDVGAVVDAYERSGLDWTTQHEQVAGV